MAHAKINDRLAAFLASIQFLDRRPHFLQRFDETNAERIGKHAFKHEIGAWNHERGDEGKGRRRWIGGHAKLLRRKLGASLQCNSPPLLTVPLDADLRAE